MKNIFVVLLSIVLFTKTNAQISFSQYFTNQTLRFDYSDGGWKDTSDVFFEDLKVEQYWAGSTTNLIEPFDLGIYQLHLYDSASNTLIYNTSYNTLYNEWVTTEEAKTTKRTYYESVVMPFPRNNVRLELYKRNKKNQKIKIYTLNINPLNYFIKNEKENQNIVYNILDNGNPSKKLDIVFLAEGYTKEQIQKFENDVKRYSQYLFNSSPFKENKSKINIKAIFVPSEEEGTDVPGQNIWKKTVFNTHFYTFGTDRYLTSRDMYTVRNIAAQVPYDRICILVNTNKYGGGGIYNFYSIFTADNSYAEYVFIHEFGHSLADLADEYYTSEVAYQDYYDLTVEPREPNITTLVDFESKWKKMVDKNTPIPTPIDKSKYDNVLGAFEGGGYIAKGIYRPQKDCTMKSATIDNFCPVCKNAIEKMIEYYSE